MNNNKEAEVLLVASLAAAELRSILGVEVSGPQFLAACRAADEKAVECLGSVPERSADELAKILCDIAFEQGWILTYKLERVKEGEV
jgi:hypothetical protein